MRVWPVVCSLSRSAPAAFATLGPMAPQHPVMRLREVEHGLGLLAAEVEDHLDTKPINLLYWRRELQEVVAELEEGRWEPTSGTRRARTGRRDRPASRHE